jgi:hypothetical protein
MMSWVFGFRVLPPLSQRCLIHVYLYPIAKERTLTMCLVEALRDGWVVLDQSSFFGLG